MSAFAPDVALWLGVCVRRREVAPELLAPCDVCGQVDMEGNFRFPDGAALCPEHLEQRTARREHP